MKKSILTALVAIVCLSVNAQTVITNNYDSSTNSADGQSVQPNTDDEKESFGYLGLMYYSFDGFENYGAVTGIVNPNGIGYELAIRSQFKKHGNYNFELLLNYSFGLWAQGANQVAFTLAAGPSMRSYEEIEGMDKYGNFKYKAATAFDCILNPRLTAKFGNLIISGGYYYWAPKFKFSKDDGATGGLNIGVGVTF